MLCCGIDAVAVAGRFEDEIEAAKAYDKAAAHLYGRNACTNFGLEACYHDNTEVRCAGFGTVVLSSKGEHTDTRSEHMWVPLRARGGATKQQAATSKKQNYPAWPG
jgi:hypothetical protein